MIFQLKDLVVDLEPFFNSLKAVAPWLIIRPDHDGHVAPQALRKVEGPATCILCGVCESSVESPGRVGPAALVKSLRLALGPRDLLGGEG
ncbi:MAG: hypothetical protein K6U74_16060 [Firmicutes bacterium]|nr:hypothetical protein [Bacillota bacterium]